MKSVQFDIYLKSMEEKNNIDCSADLLFYGSWKIKANVLRNTFHHDRTKFIKNEKR